MARGRNGICQNIIETVYRGTDTRGVSTAKFGCVNRVFSPPGNKKEPTSCVFRFACTPKRSLLLVIQASRKGNHLRCCGKQTTVSSSLQSGECLRKPPKESEWIIACSYLHLLHLHLVMLGRNETEGKGRDLTILAIFPLKNILFETHNSPPKLCNQVLPNFCRIFYSDPHLCGMLGKESKAFAATAARQTEAMEEMGGALCFVWAFASPTCFQPARKITQSWNRRMVQQTL